MAFRFVVEHNRSALRLPSDPIPHRRERADRKRNRDAIVAAARAAFAHADAAGEAVSMNEVARVANVGIATLYRHFPSRDQLADAVYQTKLDEVTARVRVHTRDLDALASLRAWVSEFAAFMLATRGMMDTLRSAWQSATPSTSAATTKIAGVIAEFLAAGAADGSIRDDVNAMDITIAILALLSTTPPDGPGTRATRLLELFTDSLATRAKRTDDNNPFQIDRAPQLGRIARAGADTGEIAYLHCRAGTRRTGAAPAPWHAVSRAAPAASEPYAVLLSGRARRNIRENLPWRSL